MPNLTEKSLATRPDGTVALSDFYASGYLAGRGFRILRVQPGRHGRHSFVFAGDNGLPAAYIDFLNNGQIGVRDYVSALFSLKRLLRELEHKESRR